MEITLTHPDEKQHIRTYPCLMMHLGNAEGLGGNGDWKDTIVVAATRHKGMVVKTDDPPEGQRKVGVVIEDDFNKPFWIEFFGVVEFDNRLPAVKLKNSQPERKLDPDL